MTTKSGKCLCGAVTFQAQPFGTFQACHCDTCRTWGGGPFMAVPCKNATFEGPLTSFVSSVHAERGFCPTCGTHLFFHALGPDVYGVPYGLFADSADLAFKAEFFIDGKPEAYAFSNDTKHLTGAEFQAKFR